MSKSCHLGKQLFTALFLELHSDDILALRREVGLGAGVAVRHEIADDEQSGVAILVVGKKLPGGRAEEILFSEKKLDELALRDFQFLRRCSNIGTVIRIDKGIVVIGFGLCSVQLNLKSLYAILFSNQRLSELHDDRRFLLNAFQKGVRHVAAGLADGGDNFIEQPVFKLLSSREFAVNNQSVNIALRYIGKGLHTTACKGVPF